MNHISTVLCLLSRADHKLFRNTCNSKQRAYSKQWLKVKMQLWISFILLETVYITLLYFYSDGSWIRYTYMLMQELRVAIETVIIFLYINVVLMVK
jgi:hypothetical protein